MNSRTRKITDGAMLIAIFAMLLLFNRYTAMVFEEIIIFVLPIPMAAYAIKYGFKDSIPVAIGMALISAITGNVTSLFYRLSKALIGLVFGSCLHRKVDTGKTMFLVILMSVIADVLNTLMYIVLFGYNIQAEVMEMQKMFMSAAQTAGMRLPENMFTTNYFMQMFLISMVFAGILQGIVTYVIGLVVLKRLHFDVPKPKSVFYFYPPVITGWICLVLLGAYVYSLAAHIAEPMATVLQMLGVVATVYLCVFGFLFIMLLLKAYVPGMGKFFRPFIAFVALMIASQVVVMLGFMYITGYQHQALMDKIDPPKRNLVTR